MSNKRGILDSHVASTMLSTWTESVACAQEPLGPSVWSAATGREGKSVFRPAVRTTLLMIAFALAGLIGRPSSAEGACDNLRPDESRPEFAYGRRIDSDRCEGFYVAPDSSGGLDLLSLMWGQLNYASASRVLEVRLGNMSTRTGEGFRIALRGRGLPDDLHYWMAGELGDGPFHIRLSDVIQPARILPSEIGLYASRSNLDGERVYMPVHVLVDGKPLENDDVLFAVVRAQSDIKNLSWRLHVPGEKLQPSNLVHLREWVRAGTPVAIPFKPPAHDGSFDLEVTYQGLHDSSPTTLPIHISTEL